MAVKARSDVITLVRVNDGAKGDQGIPGKDGKSPTVSVSKSGTVTTIVVTNADGSKTTQTVNDGVNGTPGAKGADGKTSYLHVKYSNDGGKTFTTNSGETVGDYIGTCTDFSSADPTTVSSYTWAKIKGATGATGAAGTSYWVSHEWIDVSASTYDQDTYYPVVGSEIPRNGTHRIKTSVQLNSGTKPKWSSHNAGFSVDLDIQTQASGWGTTHAVTYILLDDYDWCVSGAPSPVSFVQKSAASAPVLYLRGGGKYYVETTYSCSWSIKTSEYYTYQGTTKKGPVSPTKTRPAVEGKPIKGEDGISPTVSVSKTGSTTTISITDKNGTHTQTVLDGTNGTPGAKGADGRTTYFHVKYSNDGGKTFTANSGETVGTYIGTCTDYNSADPTSVSSYTWARIKGDTGATGAQGPKGATGAQGPKGVKGDTGISVTLTVDEWYLSTSSGSLSGGSWSDKRQAWASGKYYWRRIKTTYSDGRTSYTPSNSGYYDAVITDSVAKANDAYSIADGKNAIYYRDIAPAGSDYAVNDVWFDTKNDNVMYYWDGSRWLRKPFGTTAVKDGAILADKLAVNSVTSDKILAGAINADKIAANAVSLGNLDSTLVTSNILGASVSNLSTWHGTNEFISAATMTYSDDYMTSFSYTGVANWEHAYYIVNGLNNDEQYTVSFEVDAPDNLSTLVVDMYPEQTAGYVPFCIFTEAGFSSRKNYFKSGDLATIKIPPTAGNHRYSVSFTAKSTVIMAFNFGQLANGVQMTFSVGKFKLESGSADTGWVVPRGLYLDNDELRINADSIRTGTLDAINITGSTITGGTINGAVINGGTGNFTGDINATSITAKQKYRIYDTFSNGTKTVELASMSGTYDAPTLLIGDGFGSVTVALNGSAGQSEPAFNVGINGTGTLMCNTAVATNFIGNWNGLSADFYTYSGGATWIPVFNNMKLQHTFPNDIANLAGCARVCRTGWAKTLDCGLKHGIVIISNYRAYLFWYAGTSPNMAINYKAIYGGDANTTFKELNKTGTGNCWRITVAQNSSITVIGGY